MKKYILHLMFFVCLTVTGQAQWYWYNPATEGYSLYDISFPSATSGWAVGNKGKILHYDGQRWETVPGVTNQILHGVCFLDPDHGWAVGDQGTILKYENGTWSPMNSNTTLGLMDVTFTSPTNGWAVGFGILHYDGSEWSTIDTIGFEGLYKVDFSDANHGWAGGQYALFEYTSQGWSWHPLFNNGIYCVRSIYLMDSVYGWVGGWHDDVIPFILDDPLTGLNHQMPSPDVCPNGLFFDAPGHGWACGYISLNPSNRSVWEFKNNTWELSWEPMNLPFALTGISADEFYVSLQYGHILHHDTSGFRLSNSLAEGAIELSFPDTAHGWVVGEGEEILKYSMGHLSVDTLFPNRVFHYIHFSDTNYGVAAASLKTNPRDWSLYTYYDGKWHFISNGLTDITGVCSLTNGDAWASASYYNDGKVYHVTGNTISSLTFPGIGMIWGICFTDPDHGWIGCQTSSLENCFIKKFANGTWTTDYSSSTPLEIRSISMANQNSGWAAGCDYNGCVTLKYDGQSWTKVTDVPGQLRKVLNPEPGIVYGLNGHTLYTLEDGVWTTETINIENQSLNSIATPELQAIWLGGFNGGILSTRSPFPVGQPHLQENPVTSITLSPNPCRLQTTIYYSVSIPGTQQVFLLDLSGKVINQYRFYQTPGYHSFDLSTSGLQPGMYICKFLTSEGIQTTKLVKI